MPLGGGIGKIFHLGKLPVNTQFGAYYNVVHPDDGANWQLRAAGAVHVPEVTSLNPPPERMLAQTAFTRRTHESATRFQTRKVYFSRDCCSLPVSRWLSSIR